MINKLKLILSICLTMSIYSPVLSQKLPEFGIIPFEDIKNIIYKPDPGADAIVLSDIAVARLKHDSRSFFVEMERDVRIKIVNNSGFDYANINIPYLSDEAITNFKASTFNLYNGNIIEAKIPTKDFITEKTSESFKTLKFIFPDVHEGSVIEYSYTIRMGFYSLYLLVPWMFQREIPVALSSLTVEYPVSFAYKYTLSGTPANIRSEVFKGNVRFLSEYATTDILQWTAVNVPAFMEEPHILGRKEHLSKLTFELARVDLPEFQSIEITPTYATLTKKLLESSDFGTPLKTDLKYLTNDIVGYETNDLLKLKSIYKYVATNIFWNGEAEFTMSATFKKIIKKKIGNSADINLLLIAMLRSAGLTADPVLLSTRSNGRLNTISALLQQFNYVIARVKINDKIYLVDATDPLRPFNELPFECLNKTGRLISESESKFIDLFNEERRNKEHQLLLEPDEKGNLKGKLTSIYSGFEAYELRKIIRLESDTGYIAVIRKLYPEAEISDFRIFNLFNIDSVIKTSFSFIIPNGCHITNDEIYINPHQLNVFNTNPFSAYERKFPVDFGCPESSTLFITINLPDGYSLAYKSSDVGFEFGKNEGTYNYAGESKDNHVFIKSTFKIKQPIIQQENYLKLYNFYAQVQSKQAEFIVIKKK